MSNTKDLVLAGGCFWGVEELLRKVPGVTDTEVGYAGGARETASYEHVKTGQTGHAEAIKITYDPSKLPLPRLLELFFKLHDPTTLNRQGNDVGPQYRSAVFYHSDRQRMLTESYKAKIDAAGVFPRPVVTEVVPVTNFYPADAGHQDFYARNAGQPYCRVVIGPKLDKLRAVFRGRLLAGG